MRTVLICCEGPSCNGGLSADQREAAIVSNSPCATAEMRDEAERYARRVISPRLAVTPHERVGLNRRGQALFACVPCGFERVYGHTLLT